MPITTIAWPIVQQVAFSTIGFAAASEVVQAKHRWALGLLFLPFADAATREAIASFNLFGHQH